MRFQCGIPPNNKAMKCVNCFGKNTLLLKGRRPSLPSTDQLQTIGQGSKTLICNLFTKTGHPSSPEHVFLNFPGYSLTPVIHRSNPSKCYKATPQIPQKISLFKRRKAKFQEQHILLACLLISSITVTLLPSDAWRDLWRVVDFLLLARARESIRFCERHTWSPAEFPVCKVSTKLNVLHQAASCFSWYDIPDIGIPVYTQCTTHRKKTQTRDSVGFQEATTHEVSEDSPTARERFVSIWGSSRWRSLRVTVNRMFYLNPKWTDFDKHTHLQINLVFTGDSSEPLDYDVLQEGRNRSCTVQQFSATL
ncbi:hypothetical protein T265_10671 [Opisthorchis viverrini]|uniref:Uncharacterized protein n=1 Tax=Opisthorchis viverrini TaxID=6198 RepID=A0A074Z5Q2_OPIVI|nr:hypothetical protein T265_10671 [Opisthorchis viverrini]KER20862.1 hypothetical protein T265_10671 [Opisthorchis viverrini]